MHEMKNMIPKMPSVLPKLGFNMGPQHAHLGHFASLDVMRQGHNTTETVPALPGHKAIHFKKGGLHKSLGVPMGEPIPASKLAKAKSGNAGPKAKKQALFAANVLTGHK